MKEFVRQSMEEHLCMHSKKGSSPRLQAKPHYALTMALQTYKSTLAQTSNSLASGAERQKVTLKQSLVGHRPVVLHLVILNRGWLQTARRHLNTCTTRLYAIVEGCKEAPKHLYDLVVLNCVEGCKKASGYVSNLATAGDAKCHNNGNCRRYQVSQQWPL